MSDQVKIKVGVESNGVKTGMARIKNSFATLKQSAGAAIAGGLAGGLGGIAGGLGGAAGGAIGAVVGGPIGAAIGTAIGAAAGNAVGGSIGGIMDKAGQLQDLSGRFDVSAESLQRIGNVAEQSGVSLEGVAGAMNKLALNGEKIAGGDKGMAGALNTLGISAGDFINLDTDGKFNAISAAVAKADDQGQAYAAVTELMGRNAGELYSTLALGPDAIKAQGDAVGVMTDETVQKLDILGDKLTALKSKFTAFGGNALGKVVGAFIGDDDPDVKAAKKKREEQKKATKGQRDIEGQDGTEDGAGKKQSETIADAMTKAGGGGIAYATGAKDSTQEQGKNIASMANDIKTMAARVGQITTRTDPSFWKDQN